jgi:cell division protein FtsB
MIGEDDRVRGGQWGKGRFYRPRTLLRLTHRRLAAVALLLGVAWLGGNFFFSEYGLRNLLRERRAERRLEGEIARLTARREQLVLARDALQRDPAAIERVAREKYLLGREGEMTYVFVPVDSTGAPLRAAASGPPAVAGAGPK